MSPSSVILEHFPTWLIDAGVEVYTPRGFGRVVCGLDTDSSWPGLESYIVELDDDQGRTVMKAADLQVVERVGS